jgi:hypothetical protein
VTDPVQPQREPVEPTEPYLLRRERAPRHRSRGVLIAVLVFFVLLIVAVVVPLVVVGEHNSGVKIPPGGPPPSSVPISTP